LRFIPAAKLEEEGYASYLSLFDQTSAGSKTESRTEIRNKENSSGDSCESSVGTAVLAGGCFWGVEEIIRTFPGVLDVEAGYTGGRLANPEYSAVSTDSTGHAEAVKITYDPSKTSYEAIVRFFFKLHDPTTKNRQGNDIGTRYRSAIFVKSDKEREIAEKVIQDVSQSGKWKNPVVTTIEDAGAWWKAEEYHQDYLQKHPGGYTCHYLRE
jgi:peptide methionine sulfoxide reductase msrA/msrB